MTLDQISSAIAKEAGLTKKQSEAAYKAFTKVIKEEANKEMETVVALPKIGKFTVRYKDAYMGRNPKTGESIEVGPMRKITFSAYDTFKASLNEIL